MASPQPAGRRVLRVLHMAHIRWYNAEAQYALDLAEEMGRQGHHVGFFAQAGSPAARHARDRGLEVAEEAGFNAKGIRSLGAIPATGRLFRLLRRGRFHAVEMHRSEGLPLVALACRAAGVPVVRVRGDMRPVRGDPVNRFLYRRVLAGVVASNFSVERGLRDRLGSLERLATIHGGVDPSVFTPDGDAFPARRALGLPEDAFLVGILGRLGPVKGHRDFFDAAARCLRENPGAAFVVLSKGSGELTPGLRAAAEGHPGLAGRLRVLGNRPDLPEVLRAFDLGVVASVGSEANCRVGLEWMASGVPLVATRVGVLPDLVEDGVTGYLVDPGAPAEMADRVGRFAADPGRARHAGRAARQRVLDRFTIGQCARAHAEFLRRIVEGRAP